MSVSLEGNEKYTITNTINVNEAIKSITIEGNGHVLDGDYKYGFLNINQSCNLTINNVTIQNAYTIPELKRVDKEDGDYYDYLLYTGE